ncbi:MAG TPA: hypothetical protein ACFYD6_05345 [Candidatus Brocadiia bacterium]|nr:hypothetical protein [Planctomycetota bacterium]MDO8091914.1 hypothetical protein [Candidatus Brocadiales bacterium]
MEIRIENHTLEQAKERRANVIARGGSPVAISLRLLRYARNDRKGADVIITVAVYAYYGMWEK